MGFWGATRECCRNCCGGPHSEHYDAWLARERLRQINAQTQKNDQLQKQNAQLEMALNHAQDVMASYRDIDIMDTGSIAGMQPASSIASAHGRSNSQRPSMQPMMTRGSQKLTDVLPEAPQRIRREDLGRPASPETGPNIARAMTPKNSDQLNSGVLDRGRSPSTKAAPRRDVLGRAEQATPQSRERQAAMAKLRSPLPTIPSVSSGSAERRRSEEQMSSRPSPFGTNKQQSHSFARTHDYRPGPN